MNNQASIQGVITNPTLAGSKSDTREYYVLYENDQQDATV
jgi:hypothetical protein